MIKDQTMQYVALFDRALTELGELPLSANRIFQRDAISSDSYLRGILSVSGSVALTITIGCDGIEVHPDRMDSSAFFWSLRTNADQKEHIIRDIKAILTASVQVVYRSRDYTECTFFDSKTGKKLRVLTEMTIFGCFFWLCKKNTIVYSPIFPNDR